jgi:Domain of unknown function (DUF4337)
MEAHEALRRQEHVSGGDDHLRDGLARPAALVVAVIAAFLAVATFMANEAVKEAITGETKAADTTARLEANETKLTIADGNATLLRVIGAGTATQKADVIKAQARQAQIKRELAPVDRRLAREIEDDHADRDHADDQHLVFELSAVALQIGIVLAGISILAGRRWLLGAGGLVAVAGVGLLILGVLF